MKLHWLVGMIVWAATCAGRAADFPSLVLPQGVGVNIHFTGGHGRDLDLIADAGFKFIRMDFSWGGTERQKGQYNWAAYEELVRDLEQRGLRAIFILDYSNDLYEPGASPQHPESVAAFARWAGAAARHFKGRRILWEIWNEPNIDFWKPKPDVHQYIALAKATCQAIRENDPEATIIAPASSEFPWQFLEEMFKAGLLSQLDGISVHPYRHYQRGPETAADDYLRLRSLIERYAPPAKRAMPILSGEWGYATHKDGVSLETQAVFLARQQLANLLYGVPLSIWYDWKNDGPNPDYNEHNFGTVYPDLRPKPAYEALQVLTRELSGYHVAHRLDVGQPEACVVLMVNPAGEQKLAVWSTQGERTASLDVGLSAPGSMRILDGKGKSQPVNLQDGRVQLALSPLPSYVAFNERSPVLSAAAAWQIREPFARSVKADAGEGLTLTIALQNPFPHPVRVEASLTLPESTVRKTVELGQGKTAEVKLAGPISRRDLAQIPVTLAVAMRDAAGKELGGGTEHLLFHLANPLRLAVAPAQRALRVSVEDGAGASFNGHLDTGNQNRPISLTPATSNAVVEFSLPNSGADAIAGPFNLIANSGEMVAQIPQVKFHPIVVANYKASLDGDAKVAATAAISEVAAPGEDAPYAKGFALDYEFGEGWRFVRCVTSSEVQFETRPKAIGVWVYGDKSGNSLRLRLRDSSGQTFQLTGPNLSWTGWQWVTFDLEHLGDGGHWGGANDGVAKGALTLDTALLLDGTRRKTAGRIYFAGLTSIY